MGNGLLDFGARGGYDAAIGRLHQVDAAAELFVGVSGYSFGLDNPIFNIDPTGDTTVPASQLNMHTFDTSKDQVLLNAVTVTAQRQESGSSGSVGGWLSDESGQRVNRDGSPYWDPNGMFATQLMIVRKAEGSEWVDRVDNLLAIFSPLRAFQGLFLFSKTNPAGKVIAIKQLSAKASQEISKNFSKINDRFLKDSGIDAHQIKKDFLGKKAKISEYDLYKQNETGEILILKKGGKGSPIQTSEFLK